MSRVGTLIVGAGLGLGARSLVIRVAQAKLRSDLERLNAGDPTPLLANYADDAVLRFHEGSHRWSGEHRGKPAIERFLRNFVRAGLQGSLRTLWTGGPLWALTLVARFDDRAGGADGEELYSNRVVLVVRTRLGRIVEQDTFFEDTGHIAEFDAKLTALGIAPIA